MKHSTIGIFDSGLGGLTVLRTLAERFPHESFTYVGDVARLPYGNKSPQTVRAYGEQILNYLLKQNVKLLIIACNTASTMFVSEDSFQGIPLLNVIGPGSQAALAVTKNNKVGVIGTSTTVMNHAYAKTIASMKSAVIVTEVACPLFVPLAEEGWSHDSITRQIGERYLQPIKDQQCDTLILGCTHYPILRDDIAMVVGAHVKLIESGEVLADKITSLAQQGLPLKDEAGRTIDIQVTDLTLSFEKMARKLMGPFEISQINRINL